MCICVDCVFVYFVYLCICVFVYLCICVFVYLCICVFLNLCICVFVYLCICVFVHLKGTIETEDEYDCRNGGSTCRRGALLRADHDVGVEPWKRERGS